MKSEKWRNSLDNSTAEERADTLVKELPKLQAEMDYIQVNQLWAETVAAGACAPYTRRPTLPVDEKRKIAENLCQKITFGETKLK